MPSEPSTERNKRVCARYDELMHEGKHGHYETLIRVVNEELALFTRQNDAPKLEEDDLMLNLRRNCNCGYSDRAADRILALQAELAKAKDEAAFNRVSLVAVRERAIEELANYFDNHGNLYWGRGEIADAICALKSPTGEKK